MKNFVFLLLSPLTFDIKKSEQIESCTTYPFQNDINEGIIQATLPNGIQFKTTVSKKEGSCEAKIRQKNKNTNDNYRDCAYLTHFYRYRSE